MTEVQHFSTEAFWGREGAGKAYDRESNGLIGWYMDESETRPFRDLVGMMKGAKVLDVGCGTGRHLALFNDTNKLHGVDLSSEMLAEASRKIPCAKLVKAAADALPFPDGSFDVVLSARLLQHLRDQEKMVREMARVCKPGGQIILLSYNAWSLLCLYKQVRMSWLGRVLNVPFRLFLGRRSFFSPWGFAYDNYCSLPELAAMFRRCGVRVRQTWGATSGVPWFWNDFFIGKVLQKAAPFLFKPLLDCFLFVDGTLARRTPLKYFIDKVVIAGQKNYET